MMAAPQHRIRELEAELDQVRTAYRLEADSVVWFGAQLETERAQGAVLEAKLRAVEERLERAERGIEEALLLAQARGRRLADCNGRSFSLREIIEHFLHDLANAMAAKTDALEAYYRVRLRAEKAEQERDEARNTGRMLVGLVVHLAPYPPEQAEGALALVETARSTLGMES